MKTILKFGDEMQKQQISLYVHTVQYALNCMVSPKSVDNSYT